MKYFQKLLALLLILSLVVINNGCKKESATEPPPAINEAEELVKYLENTIGTGQTYIYDCASFVIDASVYRTEFLADPSKILTIDIRTAADYNAKRLKRAINVSLANLRTVFDTLNFDRYNRIVVVCYSGQTSAYAVSLMRALQPNKIRADKIVSLKFGMSSIDSSFAQNYWLTKRGNTRIGDFKANDPPVKPAKGNLPTLNTGKRTGRDILVTRVDSLLKAGFTIATISDATLYQNLSNYFIVNYWPLNLYKDPGHIEGAYHYDPVTRPFMLANDLKTLPTNKIIVMYCYTGQTSAYIGAYLRLMGYDVKSLLYGANSMIYNLMIQKNVPNAFKPETDIKVYRDLLEP